MAANLLSLTLQADKDTAADRGAATDKGGKGSVDHLLKHFNFPGIQQIIISFKVD